MYGILKIKRPTIVAGLSLLYLQPIILNEVIVKRTQEMNSKLKNVGFVAILLCPNNVVAVFSVYQYSPLSGYHNVAPVASCV